MMANKFNETGVLRHAISVPMKILIMINVCKHGLRLHTSDFDAKYDSIVTISAYTCMQHSH